MAHLDVGGVRLNVVTAGDPHDPAVVLIHGWPQHSRCWQRVIPRLEGRYVIAPDLRGFGASDAPPGRYAKTTLARDVVGVLDALGVDRATVAGHDWGGYIAWMVALHAPERVERLAVFSMIDPWYRPELTLRSAASFWYQIPIVTPGLNRLAAPHIAKLMRLVGAADFSDEDVEAYGAPYRDPAKVRAAAALYRHFPVRELGRHDAYRARMPVTVATGTEDPVIFPNRIRDPRADDLRIEILEGAGHFLPEEHPDFVADLILHR